jgi:hypothetical protein
MEETESRLIEEINREGSIQNCMGNRIENVRDSNR